MIAASARDDGEFVFASGEMLEEVFFGGAGNWTEMIDFFYEEF